MQDGRQVERQERRINGWLVAAACVGGFLVALLALLGLGYVTKWEWVGVADKVEPSTLWDWLGFNQETQYKTLWDWLDLLIVPMAVAIGVLFLEHAQRARDQQAERDRREGEEEMEALRRERELEVEDRRAHQEAALLAYLDRMDDMLLRLRETTARMLASEDSEILSVILADTRTLIRARTLTVLERLDGARKGAMMRFLSESGLLDKGRPTTISLREADFRGADLSAMNLSNKDLREASFTNANLSTSDLSGADLRGADLSRADLSRTRLGTARTIDALSGEAVPLNQTDLRGLI